MSTFLGMPAPPPRAPYGTAHLRRQRQFPRAAHDELPNEQLRRNLGRATGTIRAKRIGVTGELPDWEQLRDAGSAIKTDTMNRLPELLEQLEAKVTERGGTVHWARDGVEANAIVTRLVKATGSSDVIKVKSMATQEIGLNEHLEAEGITPYETDLAELIVQLADDKPSHISCRRSTATATRSGRSSSTRSPASTRTWTTCPPIWRLPPGPIYARSS